MGSGVSIAESALSKLFEAPFNRLALVASTQVFELVLATSAHVLQHFASAAVVEHLLDATAQLSAALSQPQHSKHRINTQEYLSLLSFNMMLLGKIRVDSQSECAQRGERVLSVLCKEYNPMQNRVTAAYPLLQLAFLSALQELIQQQSQHEQHPHELLLRHDIPNMLIELLLDHRMEGVTRVKLLEWLRTLLCTHSTHAASLFPSQRLLKCLLTVGTVPKLLDSRLT
jgi:hypothetical protein